MLCPPHPRVSEGVAVSTVIEPTLSFMVPHQEKVVNIDNIVIKLKTRYLKAALCC